MEEGDEEEEVAWLIMFDAGWCEKSAFVNPVFSSIASSSSSSSLLRFGKVDITKHPSLAQDYNIELVFKTFL